jgi:hypothetical protein
MFPEYPVGSDDGGREARNARLDPERLEVLLKEIEDEPLRARRGTDAQNGSSEDQEETSHSGSRSGELSGIVRDFGRNRSFL